MKSSTLSHPIPSTGRGLSWILSEAKPMTCTSGFTCLCYSRTFFPSEILSCLPSSWFILVYWIINMLYIVHLKKQNTPQTTFAFHNFLQTLPHFLLHLIAKVFSKFICWIHFLTSCSLCSSPPPLSKAALVKVINHLYLAGSKGQFSSSLCSQPLSSMWHT